MERIRCSREPEQQYAPGEISFCIIPTPGGQRMAILRRTLHEPQASGHEAIAIHRVVDWGSSASVTTSQGTEGDPPASDHLLDTTLGRTPARDPCIRRYLQLLEPNVQLALLVRMRHEGTEPLLVFLGGYKRADHPTEVVWLTVVEYVQPEIVTVDIGISNQVTKVLHQHK